MANLDQAATLAQEWAEKLRGFIDLADALKGMASVEQAIAERKAALVQATADHEAMVAQNAALKDETDAIQAAHDAAIADHEDKAAAILAAANADADTVRTDAKTAADGIVAAARTDAERVQTAAAQTVAGLNDQANAARQQLAVVTADLATAQVNLVSMQAATDALRAQAKAISGG